MKVIVYNGDSGNAYVLTPIYPEELTPAEEDAFMERLQQKDVPPLPDGSPRPSWVKELNSPEIARMSNLFESWKVSSKGEIYWDAAAGRELKKREIRQLRKPLLEALDVEFMRALEAGDTGAVAAISAKKKALRDLTQIDMSAYDTPEKLHRFIPQELNSTQ